jgi:hypothetical protein
MMPRMTYPEPLLRPSGQRQQEDGERELDSPHAERWERDQVHPPAATACRLADASTSCVMSRPPVQFTHSDWMV